MRLMVHALALLVATAAVAAAADTDPMAPAAPEAAAPEEDRSPWQFEVAPYAWISGSAGTLDVEPGGELTVAVRRFAGATATATASPRPPRRPAPRAPAPSRLLKNARHRPRADIYASMGGRGDARRGGAAADDVECGQRGAPDCGGSSAPTHQGHGGCRTHAALAGL